MQPSLFELCNILNFGSRLLYLLHAMDMKTNHEQRRTRALKHNTVSGVYAANWKVQGCGLSDIDYSDTVCKLQLGQFESVWSLIAYTL